MKNEDEPIEKKTLMKSLENLNSKARAIEELNNLSYHLLNKFTNPRQESSESLEKNLPNDEIKKNKNLDLVDLFNETANMMDENINSIGKNLEKILHIVE